VIDNQMILNDGGKMVEKWVEEMKNKYPNIDLGEYVVMPNHFHCIIEILSGKEVGKGKALREESDHTRVEEGDHTGVDHSYSYQWPRLLAGMLYGRPCVVALFPGNYVLSNKRIALFPFRRKAPTLPSNLKPLGSYPTNQRAPFRYYIFNSYDLTTLVSLIFTVSGSTRW
jgi:hypothetical protein